MWYVQYGGFDFDLWPWPLLLFEKREITTSAINQQTNKQTWSQYLPAEVTTSAYVAMITDWSAAKPGFIIIIIYYYNLLNLLLWRLHASLCFIISLIILDFVF